jgi:hypothetical protein
MSDPNAPFLKHKKQRSRKKCPNKQIMAQDLWLSIRLYGTRLLYHAPWNQAPRHQPPQYQALWSHVPRHQASQHQRPQQQFVPANHSGKSKTKSKHFKRPQKMEDDQYCREPPIWMQSMMEWMGQQMKSYQQPPTGRQAYVRKKEVVHPMRGNRLT